MEHKQYRYELKFILNRKQAEVLKHRLSLLMEVDANSVNPNHTYFIRSLSFDDLEDSAYYEKVDGIYERNKYRIRIYNLDDSYIRLERKEKTRDLTYKKQAIISKDACLRIIKGDLPNPASIENELVREFAIKQKLSNLKPSVIVDYERLAYTYPVEDVRVTFDENIKSGRFSDDLFDPDLLTFDVLEPDEVVLEVKYNNYIPSHLVSVITSIPSLRQAVSKFALCREKKEV